MKKAIVIFLILFAPYQLRAQTTAERQRTPDETAIIKIIEAETQMYFLGDFKGWSSKWMHTDDAFWTAHSKDFNMYFVGWNNIESYLRGDISYTKQQSKNNAIPFFINKNYKIRLQDNKMAWVIYDQEEQTGAVIRETRVLVKDNGEWKILLMGAYTDADIKPDN